MSLGPAADTVQPARPVHADRAAKVCSGEGKGNQARAQKREAGCGQCQKTVGDKVMIAHDAPSDIDARSI
jgi:hypothetical protein